MECSAHRILAAASMGVFPQPWKEWAVWERTLPQGYAEIGRWEVAQAPNKDPARCNPALKPRFVCYPWLSVCQGFHVHSLKQTEVAPMASRAASETDRKLSCIL